MQTRIWPEKLKSEVMQSIKSDIVPNVKSSSTPDLGVNRRPDMAINMELDKKFDMKTDTGVYPMSDKKLSPLHRVYGEDYRKRKFERVRDKNIAAIALFCMMGGSYAMIAMVIGLAGWGYWSTDVCGYRGRKHQKEY